MHGCLTRSKPLSATPPSNADAPRSLLVHGWDRIKNVHVYSLLGLSTQKKCKMLLNYDKVSMVGTVPNLSWEASSGDGDGRIFRQCTEVIVATQHLPWGTIAGSNDHFEIHDIVIDMNAVCWQRNANAIEIRRSATTDHNNLLPSGSKHVF